MPFIARAAGRWTDRWLRSRRAWLLLLLLIPAPVLMIGAGLVAPAAAQSNPLECGFTGQHPPFPAIPLCIYPGAWQDSTLLRSFRCAGSFRGPQPDSLREQPRTLTVRFWRDRRAEARTDFGGYRIYRVTNSPDSTRMVLIRRFSRQGGTRSRGISRWSTARCSSSAEDRWCTTAS